MLLMAPRRNHNTNSIVTQQTPHHHQQQQQQQQQHQHLTSSSNYQTASSSTSSTATATTSAAFSSVGSLLFNNLFGSALSEDHLNQQQQQSAATLGHANGATPNMSPMQTAINATNNNNNTNNNSNHNNTSTITSNGNGNMTPNHHNNNNKGSAEQYVRCCYPNGECIKADSPLINMEDLMECVKVICNNENCNVGQFMHRECFESWEQSVLQTLKSMGGRARSWSERQKAQNLWTKKGYDMVYKVCGCKCSRGHLRKDLEWVAPKAGHYINGQRVMNGGSNSSAQEDEDKKKKKNKRNRQQQQQQQQQQQPSNASNKALTPLQTNGQHNGINNSSSSNATPEPKMELAPMNNQNNSTPNVGVIGSGLHQPQQQQQQQHQQQQQNHNGNGTMTQNSSSLEMPPHVMSSINNLLNSSNNILGLDLRPRANSISSASNSGSTSPSAISFSSGELSSLAPGAATQLATLQNLNLSNGLNGLNGFYSQALVAANQQQQQQQQQSVLLQQHQQQQSSLTKNILNGLQNVGILGAGGVSVSGTTNNNTLTTNTSAVVAAATTALLLKQQQQQQQHQQQLLVNGLKQLSPFEQQQLLLQQKVKEVELYSERVRSTSGCNGIFSRRLDFSSFNLLPKTRLNSYQVKIEDEGNHGNDETRLFILSSLAQSQKSRVACILCEEPMLVFDRYPLVDGSFFLSPKQHSTDCIEVKYEGRSLYLTCVCMRCLDGTSQHRNISCRFCGDKWDGSNLVLGTMYAYDIFAAMPCCAERLKCNNCFKLLLHPQQRLNFYSDYSHCVTCPFCATQDTHFVKPLTYCYTKSQPGRLSAIA